MNAAPRSSRPRAGGVPVARRALLPRPRLAERLPRSSPAAPRLVLVAAPAGFGKTTLLSQWLSTEDRVAWLSLEAEDGEPRRFLTRLVTAVQSAAGQEDDELLALLDSDRPVPVDAVVAELLALLEQLEGRTVLALDDYHVIDAPPIHDAVRLLVDGLPPQALVAIATRADPPLPLARLRARGELLELRAADLRFTAEESAAFLRDVMALDLDGAQVDALNARIEGWAAGLQLAGLSLRTDGDRDAFVTAFTGSHRFVLDYLVEEVLAGQPEPVRDFLLDTAVLRSLTGGLCDAVTGRTDGAQTLERLERDNLFLVPLDDERRWYRYHHLFADALRARLLAQRPGREVAAHRAAAGWYADAGELSEAITHSFAAGDHARAADLVELALPEARRQRDHGRLLRWLGSVPDDEARERGTIAVGRAWTRLAAGDLAGAAEWLDAAERAIGSGRRLEGFPTTAALAEAVREHAEEVRTLPAMIAVYRASLAQARGDVAATVFEAERAVAVLGPNDHFLRGAASGFLGLAAWAAGDLPRAVRTFGDAVDSLRAAGNVVDALGATVVLAEMWLARGEPARARRLYERALAEAADRPRLALPVTGDLHVGLAAVLLEQGEPEAAARHLDIARDLGEVASLPENRYRWYVADAGLRQARGDLDGAVAQLEQATAHYRPGFFPDLRPLPAAIARLRIAQGRLDEAADWARERGITPDDPPTYAAEFDQLTLARLLIARASDDDLRDAIALLDRIVEATQKTGRTAGWLDALRLRSQLRPTTAPAHAPSGAGPAPLSDRELEVVRLLATDLTGPEIARRLFVSVNTLRTHTKHVFTKLEVTTRRAAVQRASELGLL